MSHDEDEDDDDEEEVEGGENDFNDFEQDEITRRIRADE